MLIEADPVKLLDEIEAINTDERIEVIVAENTIGRKLIVQGINDIYKGTDVFMSVNVSKKELINYLTLIADAGKECGIDIIGNICLLIISYKRRFEDDVPLDVKGYRLEHID